MKIALLIFSLLISLPAYTQQESTVTAGLQDSASLSSRLNWRQLKQFRRQMRRDSIRANKKIWMSILGGPSYTPEASLGIGGAVLMTFRMNRNDSVSQRSFIPVGFNVSINGTFAAAGAGTLFFNENKFRIYVKYGYRTEPAYFYGIGYNEISDAERLKDTYGKDSVTFHKAAVQFFPRFAYEVRKNLFVGTLLDFNYTYSSEMPQWMERNPLVKKYGSRYHNIGLGLLLQYDTRDDVATPFDGLLLSAIGTIYGDYLGGDFNYETLNLEYRQFRKLFGRRSVLAWTAMTQIAMDNVPYTELPGFGNPFDLRGYTLGKYRDKSMAYGIVEYRHMFMSQEAYERGAFWSKFGGVAWIGTGTVGNTPADWDKWKLNYGIGLRIQLQPRKNFRLDIGKEPGQKWGIYLNMTEAF